MKDAIHNTDSTYTIPQKEISGELVEIEQELYYKISRSDLLRPFFMSLISPSDHWMYISSNGGLTAGRKNSDFTLFPYYTDDRITESIEYSGNKAIIHVHKNGKSYLWEPYSKSHSLIYNIAQNLYKNVYGNKLIFEEINKDLGLTYRYQWNISEAFGFVKKVTLLNSNSTDVTISLVDGFQNILPYGVGEDLQKAYSNLVDAYKRSELKVDEGIGIFALSAIIVDKAEPSEALKANIAWSSGFEHPQYLISSRQLDAFRKGNTITQETDIKAERGAFFIHSQFNLKADTSKKWFQVLDVNKNASAIHKLSYTIRHQKNDLESIVDKDIEKAQAALFELANHVDAIQLSNDDLMNNRHFSNTLFNCMRGGLFDSHYNIDKLDFSAYLKKANKEVYKQLDISSLNDTFTLFNLREFLKDNDKLHLKRLCLEYLPLKFSRRHGDPSRPWNKFSINIKNELDGSKVLDYQGNWRDIFQNWEALALSYPEFIEGMIYKFLNATTFDGYNPYRVTKDGFDWETIEEDDPWSYIGYWGDHQIIYLQKFLEIIENYYPGRLADLFDQNIFVYANVPYKIKAYNEIVKNPKDTIDFDFKEDEKVRAKRTILGADGALLETKEGQIYTVNFVEKLLATLLAKVSNFIPEAGIWLNTQRPEWNDANNALVGNGVSMVTLYYLRRFVNFSQDLFKHSSLKDIELSEELITFYSAITLTLSTHKNILETHIQNEQRKIITDALGNAASEYRKRIYDENFSGKKASISVQNIQDFLATLLNYIDHTIKANKRSDQLYHAYNLMTITAEGIEVSNLDEMLEGQVSVLSSGFLTSKENLAVLDALKASALFRKDQYSYILYPNKELPKFLEKNSIPKEAVKASPLLQKLLTDGDRSIINVDIHNEYHFNGHFTNAKQLDTALDKLLVTGYKDLVIMDRKHLLDTYETVFNHKAFTGRSGTFFGYEGLGSIYWHMVSKLLLATQECCLKAIKEGESEEITGRLLEHYYEIKEGLGVHKSPDLYGAFPTDAYSHTPATKGAQQPGMTGQVKEDILCRFGELGITVSQSKITFTPHLLHKSEFLQENQTFQYINLRGKTKQLNILKNQLCFTYCQIPIVYQIAKNEAITITYTNGKTKTIESLTLDTQTSDLLFNRTGKIEMIHVHVPQNYLK